MKDTHDMGDDQTALIPIRTCEYVEAEGVSLVFWIEKDYVVLSGTGNVAIENVIDELAVRIYYGYSRVSGKVPGDHIPQKRALTGTCGAEDGQVFAPRLWRNCENCWCVLKPV